MPQRMTMSVPACAERLGIGRGLAYHLVRTGVIPSIRLGRRLVVPVIALERLLSDDLGAEVPDAET